MIFGLNFNGSHIPPAYARRFAKRLRRQSLHDGMVWFTLQGVATSEIEAAAMLTQADNGRRELHMERRKTASTDVFGIYTY
jgi:hypothetical protein